MLRAFKPIDVIALAAILGCLTAIFLGVDGTASNALMIVLGYYFRDKMGDKAP